MKMTEVRKAQTDETIVAVARSYGDEVPASVQRARVLGTKEKRRVYSGQRADWGGHITNDGIRIELLDPLPPSASRHNLIGAAPILRSTGYVSKGDEPENVPLNVRIVSRLELHGTYDDWKAAAAADSARKEAAREATTTAKEKCEQAVSKLNGALGIEKSYMGCSIVTRRIDHRGGPYRIVGVTIPLDQLEKLVALAEAGAAS